MKQREADLKEKRQEKKKKKEKGGGEEKIDLALNQSPFK